MRVKTFVTACFFFICNLVLAQNACSTYYPFKKGAKFEITNYNKKGKKENVSKYEVTDISNNVATIKTTVTDNKNKELITSSYALTCNGNSISFDFKSMMNPEIYKQYKDVDMEMTGTNLELPNDLQIGQKLKDANLNLAMNMSGIKMNMTIDITNRSVNAKESITTPAGTYNCFALSYTNEMKMGMKMTFKIKEWIAEGVGVVKSESYNKNGKLMGYSELTSFSK